MTADTSRDILNLHIYLGTKQGFDVSELIKMRETRYLFSIDGLYL